MTARWLGLAWVLAAVAVECFAQICMKIGASGGPAALVPAWRRRAQALPLASIPSAWVALGVAAYAVEIAFYTLALHYLDVSLAFPLGSLCFAGVAVLSKHLLGEAVGRIRALGVACIVAGTVFLAL